MAGVLVATEVSFLFGSLSRQSKEIHVWILIYAYTLKNISITTYIKLEVLLMSQNET